MTFTHLVHFGELLLILQNPPHLSPQAAIPDAGLHSPLVAENHLTPPPTVYRRNSRLCLASPWTTHGQHSSGHGYKGPGLVAEGVGLETLAAMQGRSQGFLPSLLLGLGCSLGKSQGPLCQVS